MSWQYLHWITFYNKIKAEAALCQTVTVVLEFVLNFKYTLGKEAGQSFAWAQMCSLQLRLNSSTNT